MKCPHCGKEISDFAMKCPNCGGNPKTQATKEVKEKIEINQRKQKSKSNISCKIAFVLSTIVGLFTDYIMIDIIHTGINRIINCFLYSAIICLCTFVVLKYRVYKNLTKYGYILFIALSIILNIVTRFIISLIERKYYSIELLLDMIPYNSIILYHLSNILNIIVLVFTCFFLSIIICNNRKHK